MSAEVLWAIAILLMIVGAVGIVMPALPGIPLLFVGMLVGAYADGFHRIGWLSLTVLGVLAVLSFVAELAASAIGAKRVGASQRAIWGALLGTVVGMFFGILGLLFGPFLGAVLGELSVHGGVQQAGRVGIATWVGLLLGTVAKIAIACSMIAIFAFAYFVK
jgi:hypothetical protein